MPVSLCCVQAILFACLKDGARHCRYTASTLEIQMAAGLSKTINAIAKQ